MTLALLRKKWREPKRVWQHPLKIMISLRNKLPKFFKTQGQAVAEEAHLTIFILKAGLKRKRRGILHK